MKELCLPWEKGRDEVVFDKFGRKVLKTEYKLPSGETTDFFIKAEPETVAMLAITDKEEIILTEQFRPGPEKCLHELPGGYVDVNESPIDAAARELIEETGFAGEVWHVVTFYDSAYSKQVRHAYLVTNCTLIDKPSHEQNEFIALRLFSLNQFMDLLKSGNLTDIGAAYAGLNYWQTYLNKG